MDTTRFLSPPGMPNGVAIALKLVDAAEGQFHTGLLFPQVDSSVHLVDMAWHKTVRCEKCGNGYFSVRLNVLDEQVPQIRAMCEETAKKNRGLGYGLSSTDTYSIDEVTNEIKALNEDAAGLTCATFVLLLLDRVGIRLLKIWEWPVGMAEDAKWQHWVVDQIRRFPGVADDYLQTNASAIGRRRARPTQIAGAGLYEARPVGHTDAEAGAVWIVSQTSGAPAPGGQAP